MSHSPRKRKGNGNQYNSQTVPTLQVVKIMVPSNRRRDDKCSGQSRKGDTYSIWRRGVISHIVEHNNELHSGGTGLNKGKE